MLLHFPREAEPVGAQHVRNHLSTVTSWEMAKRAPLSRHEPAVERGNYFAQSVNFVQPACDQVIPVPFDERCKRSRIELAAGDPEPRRELFRRAEKPVRN